MKKTTTRLAVKPFQKAAPVNSNQVEMDKIANDMAALFEKKISASDLAEWIAVISLPESNPEDIREFIWEIGFSLLPEFIKCDLKTKRIELLKRQLVSSFYSIGKETLYKAIGEIGINYATNFKTLRSGAQVVEDFFKTYTTFLCLCEMYDDYVFYEKELNKIRE